MSETQTIQTSSVSHTRNANRIAQEEAELQELLQQAGAVDTTESLDQGAPTEGVTLVSPEPTGDTQRVETKEEEETSKDSNLSAEEKSFKKRYGDLRRHSQDKEQEWKVKFEKLEQQLSAAAKNELVLPKSDHDIEAWAKQYPDVAGIVEAIADRKALERSADIDGRLKEIEGLRIQAKRDKAEAELLNMHPDFEQIRSNDAFHDWAEVQPKWVQDALYENSDDAKAVARVIDLYKVDSGIVNVKGTNFDKDAASSVRTKRSTTPNHDDASNYLRESQVAKMSLNEYEKRMDEITEAQRKGKFIYDMSKK